MKTNKVDPRLSLIAGLMGAKGGKARTEKKIKSSKQNLRKANAARLKLQTC
jgi:hypothetical protein